MRVRFRPKTWKGFNSKDARQTFEEDGRHWLDYAVKRSKGILTAMSKEDTVTVIGPLKVKKVKHDKDGTWFNFDFI